MTELRENRVTLRGIEIFIAVVEEASMSQGARRLGASVSAISQQIANLEASLGAVLIDRAARPFALTPAGHLFHARALRILDEVAKARVELAEGELSTFRKLRLAVVDEIDQKILPLLLAQMADAHRDCTFTVRSGLSHENLSALESRSVDLVVSADLDARAEWMEQHPILRDPFILVTATGVYDPAEGSGQLIHLPMVSYSANQVLGRLISAQLRRHRLAPRRSFEIGTNPGVLATTAQMGGWAVTTALALVSTPGLAGLEAHPLPFPAFSRRLAVFSRRDALGRVPERTATLLRNLLANPVETARAEMPWLGDSFRIIG
ncbi:LysR family transcriptional regulator [Rhodobacteraceae bacterium NNCM2]|nr:LysR family transcriptional regulator [Coraliihabitans acroporae]